MSWILRARSHLARVAEQGCITKMQSFFIRKREGERALVVTCRVYRGKKDSYMRVSQRRLSRFLLEQCHFSTSDSLPVTLNPITDTLHPHIFISKQVFTTVTCSIFKKHSYRNHKLDSNQYYSETIQPREI